MPLAQPDIHQAEDILQKQPIEIFLTDSIGEPILPDIRKRYPHLPIVVYSGKTAPNPLPACITEWIEKPADSSAIRNTLQQLMEKYATKK